MQYISKKAFDRGFKDFKNGELDCPFDVDSLNSKEWQRGFNYAYNIFLSRAKTREHYRNSLK